MRYILTRTGTPAATRSYSRTSLESLFPRTAEWDRRTPAVDIHEEEGRYVLEAELPGVAESDIEVKLEDSLLIIHATPNRDAAQETSHGNGNGSRYLVRERAQREFGRSFVLPKDVNRDAIKAHHRNGVLTLTLDKVAASKPRSIPIQN